MNEEDIKILEEKINNIKKYNTYRYDWTETDVQTVENLINRNRELEEENKIIKGNYYTLCADIQMVTSELGFPEDTIIADEMVSMIKENYIPVSLIEEKIEELDKEEQKLQDSISDEEREEYSDASISWSLCDIETRRRCYKELLQEGEDNANI